jgi:hypothetical protein
MLNGRMPIAPLLNAGLSKRGRSRQNARRLLRYRVAMAISYDRRLSDKLLVAFDQACDQNFIPVAELLLRAIEIALTREGGPNRIDKRQDLGPVIAAYARLKELQDARARG